ncbi:C12orf72 protein [Roseibium sp. TrichSKD4]|uniref:class I SAM-dependent methyltransferase n=1 Tax=Roseibium sp. TrichSKD4 TaxID=744980 RepID=UPI0001E56516|nr:methyltransferase [Roseibium sp. TrichSKD4]EFO33448.1 C12orf72 protein [Roseibium sp. TrichSKD4]
MAISDKKGFIRAETMVKPVPHVPEIQLHLADEAMSLWQKTEDELGDLGLPPPFWAFAWAGGQALGRYILDHESEFLGKTVIDFACGSGLVGIAAMKAGASHCTAIDIDPFAITATKLNAQLNEVTLEVVQADITDKVPQEVNVLFCGDVFYDQDMAAKVLKFLDRSLAKGTRVLVGDPGRSYLPKNRLEHLATYEVPIVGDLEDLEMKRSSVFELKTDITAQ